MTTSADLRVIAVQALTGTTNAKTNVFSPRDIPSWGGEYPMLIVTTPDEEGESFGRQGAPAFTVTTTLRIHARIEEPASDDDRGAMQAYVALEHLREQIKAAVINYGPLMVKLQHYPFFRSHIQVGNGGESEQHLGQLVLDIGLEFVQTPEDFYQEPSSPLVGVDIGISQPAGTTQPGASINLPT